jgi:hypothetical protein
MKVTAKDLPGNEASEGVFLNAARAWDRFFFSPSPPTTLAVMRIFAGLIVLYVLFAYALQLQAFVGPDAWLNNDTARKLRLEYPMSAPPTSWDGPEVFIGKGQFIWSLYYHVEDPVWIWVIHIGIMLTTLLFTVGFATRLTSVLTWMGYIMYIDRAATSLFGMDTMVNLGLLYLMVGPCGADLSVDRWLQVRRLRRQFGPGYVPPPPEPSVSATFATRLVQINFCMIYLMSGFSKLLGATWWNGTAPTLVLLNYSFAPFDVGLYSKIIGFLVKHRWLWELLMTLGVVFTIFVEVGLPYLIWFRKWRWFMVCCSALLHTQIGLLMGLVTFSLMMLVLLLSFIPPEVCEQVVDRLRERLRTYFRPRPAMQGPHAKTAGTLVGAR